MFIIDKINDINDRSFSSEIEYRIYLEMFMVKFCKNSFLTEVKHIKNNFKKPEVLDKNPNFNSNEEMVDLNVWKDFLDYLRKSSFMVLYSLLQNGSVQSFQNDKVLFKCNTIGIMNRLKNMNTIKQIEENLKSFFGKPLIFEVFSEMEQNDESIEDRVKKVFGWSPRWDVRTAIEKTIEWAKSYEAGKEIKECMERQIQEFFS